MTNDHARLAVVTGASSGIGTAAAEELARRGWRVVMVGRDAERLAQARERVAAAVDGHGPATLGGHGPAVDGHGAAATPARATATTERDAGTTERVTALRCDFGVLAQVRELAATLRERHDRIDVLANNAGGAVTTRRTTMDGFESTIQTNHLAPFLLSLLLHDVLRGGRIVNTASAAHQAGTVDPGDLSAPTGGYTMLGRYASAKQANILFAAEAARRWPDIQSTSFHPGVVRTRFGSESPLMAYFYRYMPFLRTPARGARTLVWLATTDAAVVNGGYYQDEKLRRPASRASDPELAARLWESSLQAVSG
jgi:NAD(P)-dependent dehydrogenase (short-subunit alcohol dehydrogenase family)